MSTTSLNWNYRGIAGSFNPLLNYIWVLYNINDLLLVTHNHEYNHLIGLLGRHLQICLLEFYLSSKYKQCTTIIENERSLLESFVAVFLSSPSRLGPSLKPSYVAPQCNMALVEQITQICHNLEACRWIINGRMCNVEFEQIERAVQQAVLNVAEKDSMYSLGASMKALRCLARLALALKDKTFSISRVKIGEYCRVVYGSGVLPHIGNTSDDIPPSPVEIGDSLEMFFTDIIRKTTGLEIKQYTSHERAEFVLRWIYKILSLNDKINQMTKLLAGITSVFAPGMFTPLVAFWKESSSSYCGELYALPFGQKPLTMPIMTRCLGDKVVEHHILPLSWITLLGFADDIRQQSSCELAHAIADFYDFALGKAVVKPFRERVIDISSHLGESLERIIYSFEITKCKECLNLRESLDDNCCGILSKEVKSAVKQAGECYTTWLMKYAEEDFRNSNDPKRILSICVSDKGNNVYKYMDVPSIYEMG